MHLTIKLYINGESQGSLGVRTTTTRNLPKDWSGVIYSDINGGSATGEKTTRAGFYGMENYYYIIVESRLNTGISIEPQAPIVGLRRPRILSECFNDQLLVRIMGSACGICATTRLAHPYITNPQQTSLLPRRHLPHPPYTRVLQPTLVIK
ncbi:hypothetical protein DXG01_004101 [Tephrocybe rancida]|nr:hypothetical protein DXG01_004101 [Tephrocybe rancida]